MIWVKVHSWEPTFQELDDRTALLEFEGGDFLEVRVTVNSNGVRHVSFDLFAVQGSFEKGAQGRRIKSVTVYDGNLAYVLNDVLYINSMEFSEKVASRAVELIRQKRILEKRPPLQTSASYLPVNQPIINRGQLWGAWS